MWPLPYLHVEQSETSLVDHVGTGAVVGEPTALAGGATAGGAEQVRNEFHSHADTVGDHKVAEITEHQNVVVLCGGDHRVDGFRLKGVAPHQLCRAIGLQVRPETATAVDVELSNLVVNQVVRQPRRIGAVAGWQ